MNEKKNKNCNKNLQKFVFVINYVNRKKARKTGTKLPAPLEIFHGASES